MPGTENIIVKSNSNPLITIGLILGSGTALYFFVAKPLIDKVKAKADLKNDEASTVKAAKGKVLKDLTGKPVTSVNLATLVFDLHDALSFPVDQGRVIRVFQSTPWGYVPKLEAMYLDKFGDNLQQMLVKKLSDTNWIKIKYNFR